MNRQRTRQPRQTCLTDEFCLSRRHMGRRHLARKGSLAGWLGGCLALSLVCTAGAGAQPEVIVGSVAAQPGWLVEVDVSLRKNGHDVRGAGVHIFFDPRYTPVAQRERGVPDCWTAPGVAQEGRFAFWPPGCWQWDETCDTLRAILVGLGSERPTLPDGPLFTCRVQVSLSAAPGRYELANDFADASNGAGAAIVPTRVSGAVIVSQPPGGGGCAIARTGQGPWTHVAAILVFLLALRWYRWLHQRTVTAGKELMRAIGRSIVALFFASVPSAGLAQSAGTIIEVSGRWWHHGSEDFGEWQGTVTLFPDGGLSGSVTLRSKDQREVFNLSAAVRGGGKLRGRLRNPRGRLEGKFAGNWGGLGFGVEPRVAIAGSLSRRSGGRLQWRVDRIDVRQKTAPAEVVADLAAGKARRLAVIVDTYPAERAVRSRNPNRTERATLSPNEQAVLASELRSLNESLVRALRDYGADVPSVVGNVPSFVITVPNLEVLHKVLAHPLVREVVVPLGDRGWTVEPLLNESLPLIGQPLVESRLRGGGRAVAVVDTGLLWNLTAGGEFVFGPGCASGPGTPNCGVLWHRNFLTGLDNDLSRPTDELLRGFHGTWVSAIAYRVAPSAGLVGLKVLGDTADPERDFERVLQALDWVAEFAPRFGIVAVNISLAVARQSGAVLRQEPCREEAELVARVRRLWCERDVLVVAASGNDRRTDALTVPACVPGVVSVGAVYDAADFTPSKCPDTAFPDRVACFSNTAPFLTLLAPGERITTGIFQDVGVEGPNAGTSAAAPHVSGAIAVLRGVGGFEEDSAACTLARLVRKGRVVTDHRNGLLFPRLDLAAAAATLPTSTGDCNFDGRVTANEIELAVDILLLRAPRSSCPNADGNGDGAVTLGEIVAAVNVRLHACPLPLVGVA